jgi:hypothetical protein
MAENPGSIERMKYASGFELAEAGFEFEKLLTPCEEIVEVASLETVRTQERVHL